MELTVATIGRAHGLRGEVALDLRTDDPEARLADGQVLRTVPASAGPLTVVSTRIQNGRWHVAFAELGDRTAAEQARGIAVEGRVATVEGGVLRTPRVRPIFGGAFNS